MYTENLSIQSFDEELWNSLENEKKRQEEHIELIASTANFLSFIGYNLLLSFWK